MPRTNRRPALHVRRPTGAGLALGALLLAGAGCAAAPGGRPGGERLISDAGSDGGRPSSDASVRPDAMPPPDLDWTPEDVAGVVITSPLVLSRYTVTTGESLTGMATITNQSMASIAFKDVVIAARPPGGTNGGGPYLDLFHAGAETLAPGASFVLTGGRTLTTADPLGAWYAYVTLEDSGGVWHDSTRDVRFTVTMVDSGTARDAGAPWPPGDGGLPMLSVSANHIVDPSGRTVVLHGVDRPSLEWSSTGDHLSSGDIALMRSAWHAHIVRVPMNQDYWLPGAAQYVPGYAGTIDSMVSWAEAAGMYVILDLHWSDQGNLAAGSSGQQTMADANSITFWQQVAARYANRPSVLFELYNEPHDVSWSVWQSGGSAGSFTAAGMQQLYDAVRGSGARNIVIIGGLNWAYDLSGVPTHRITGSNIVYNTHVYDYPGKQPSDWDSGFGFLTATDPVIATEFGVSDCSTAYVSQLIAYMDAHGMSWTAWAWYPGGCGFPGIISDWSGAALAGMGATVQSALLSYP